MFLDKYNNSQLVAYKTLKQAIFNNRLSHAYIFETNGFSESEDFIKAFVKDIFCVELEQEQTKKVSNLIDSNEYPELKIIEPSGMQIKKEEILELQENFKNKAIFNSKKIYILKNAEKLNQSSSNTLLKFLEEPSDNIIAILVVNNRYELLKTILSRCQLISLINNNKSDNKINEFIFQNSNIKEEEFDKKDFIDNVIKFISFYEKNGRNTLLFINKEFNSIFNNREKVLMAFEIMKLFYLDVLKYKTIGKIELFKEYTHEIEEIKNKKDLEFILKRIEIIIECINRIKYNVNLNLLMDYYCTK